MPDAPGSAPPFRIGQGYDSHRLAPVGALGAQGARPLIVGGIVLESPIGPVAHSDGDALIHAITDAVLGALGLPDIGQLFPDSDPRWKGAASEVFLADVRRRAGDLGWRVGNVDATVIVESPKIGPHKQQIQANLARILGVEPACVNVKGKTHERAGRPDDLIEAMAAVLMVRV